MSYRVNSLLSVLLSLSVAFCRNVHTIWGGSIWLVRHQKAYGQWQWSQIIMSSPAWNKSLFTQLFKCKIQALSRYLNHKFPFIIASRLYTTNAIVKNKVYRIPLDSLRIGVTLFILLAVHINFNWMLWSWLFTSCSFQCQETANKFEDGIISFQILKRFLVYMSNCVDDTQQLKIKHLPNL